MTDSFSKTAVWEIPRCNSAILADAQRILIQDLLKVNKKFHSVYFASSLAVEDNVITHAIVQNKLPFTIFTLDTLKLNPETYALKSQLEQFFDMRIESFQPQQHKADSFENQHGKSAMYDSLELRKECCSIRKIQPLGHALQNADAWITGQRKEQSITRQALSFEEFDALHNIPKFNPIANWSEEMVWTYIEKHHIPYNQLHHKGYPSIGCAPCTKAIRKGEDLRAGRWWWENASSKECGLHKFEHTPITQTPHEKYKRNRG